MVNILGSPLGPWVSVYHVKMVTYIQIWKLRHRFVNGDGTTSWRHRDLPLIFVLTQVTSWKWSHTFFSEAEKLLQNYFSTNYFLCCLDFFAHLSLNKLNLLQTNLSCIRVSLAFSYFVHHFIFVSVQVVNFLILCSCTHTDFILHLFKKEKKQKGDKGDECSSCCTCIIIPVSETASFYFQILVKAVRPEPRYRVPSFGNNRPLFCEEIGT